MTCINRNMPDVKRMAKESKLSAAVIAAKIGVWQTSTMIEDRFPTIEELKLDTPQQFEITKKDYLNENLEYLAQADNADQVDQMVVNSAEDDIIKEYSENKEFQEQVRSLAINTQLVPMITMQSSEEENLKKSIDIDQELPEDSDEMLRLKQDPSEETLQKAAEASRKNEDNRFEVLPAGMTAENTYHIDTNESDIGMFDRGYLRVVDKFYKKVTKMARPELLSGLYSKYSSGISLGKFELEKKLTYQQFESQMPSTVKAIYERYYGTRPKVKLTNYQIDTQNIQNIEYLKEEFVKDFIDQSKQEKADNTDLYKKFFSKFSMANGALRAKTSILKEEHMQMLEQQYPELHKDLINYSLINKNIDLQQNIESTIFEHSEKADRLEAVNNPKTTEAIPVDQGENSLIFKKRDVKNNMFLEYEGAVYERVKDQGANTEFQKIAEIDNEFIITDVAQPFIVMTKNKNNDPKRTESKIRITKTEGKGPITC